MSTENVKSADEVQFIRGIDGRPEFVVLPISLYESLLGGNKNGCFPRDVAVRIEAGETPARAWREHLELTQAEVASRMGISQSAYAQLEASPKCRPASRRKIAEALGIPASYLVS